MQSLTDIWTKRASWMKNKTWKGDNPTSGFDFSKPIHADLRYDQPNYMDLSIQDLRQVLNDILNDTFPESLSPDHFKLSSSSAPFYTTTLESHPEPTYTDTAIRIVAVRLNDQPQFTIYTAHGVFSISWYKNRGKIDSFIDTEYGTPITLEDITHILYCLKLEEDYDILTFEFDDCGEDL